MHGRPGQERRLLPHPIERLIRLLLREGQRDELGQRVHEARGQGQRGLELLPRLGALALGEEADAEEIDRARVLGRQRDEPAIHLRGPRGMSVKSNADGFDASFDNAR